MRSTIAGLTMLALAGTAQATDPKARIESGALRGSQDGGIQSFKGIPFAAPPVGPLRWRAPQPAARWNGVRDASAYGHDCMQVPFPSDAAPLGTPPAEDCLYANVWRPAGAARKLPVLVWIYGGGFVNGGSSPPTYSGAELAKQGIVVVSFNYRVGRFGTFAHPALTRADPDKGLLGNYGYMDELAALKWVRRNVAAFGGDPQAVTIVGESAGGMSVHMLLSSPMANGLFQRAVIMSGGSGDGMGAANLAATETIGLDFAESKGIAPGDGEALAKLRALSADAVTDGLNMGAMFRPGGKRTFASPFPDGKLAVDAGAAYRSGNFAHVPLMIGATSADIGGKTGMMVGGTRSAAGVIAATGVPVYEYRFSYVATSARAPNVTGAGHASDIPYFFDTVAIKYGDKATPTDIGIGHAMATYLANFTKTGNPNGDGLPAWPRYDGAGDQLMDFSSAGTPVAQKDPWGAEIDAAAKK